MVPSLNIQQNHCTIAPASINMCFAVHKQAIYVPYSISSKHQATAGKAGRKFACSILEYLSRAQTFRAQQ